ncbi:MAG: cupin domain-containing protein [Campylobacteraceae bacterium]
MNILDKLPPKSGEIFDKLLTCKNVEIAHIISSSKFEDKTYNQEEDEFVIVLKGKALLHVNNQEIVLNVGEHIFIPKHTIHKIISCEENTHWLAIYIK